MDVTITVPNWERYNPRPDVARFSWFRLEHRLPFSEGMHGLPHAQRWVWICILAMCQERGTGTLEVTLEYLAHRTETQLCDINLALIAFADPKRSWIEIDATARAAMGAADPAPLRARNVAVTPPSRVRHATRRDETRRDEEEGEMLSGIASKSGALVLTQIPIDRQTLLVEKFGEAAVREAAMDAAGWLAKTPRRRIKNMGAFLRNWLAKNREAPPPKSYSRIPEPVGDRSGAPTENVPMAPLPGPIPPWRK